MGVTAKTPEGKEIYSDERHYHTQATTCRDEKMVYGAQNKASYVRDTSLQPYESKDETFEIKLPEGVRTVDVTVELNYELQVPENKVPIHKVTRRVTLDR
ncbi:MAG: hypothetical protein K8I29_06165 [Alphaproteobacteria bacterium]|uniref:DUF4139 domain-containing protein n=1 Tax=Candidatus Nitrobium versatile TaxID=2884831 RepID=A0A953J3U2_9BACT|nr:hypothetical protein [Candidatus Nitrobium versatile]